METDMETDIDDVQVGGVRIEQPEKEVRDRSLSPKSQQHVDDLIKDLKSKKASVNVDDNGEICVRYGSETKTVKTYKDVTQTEKIVSPKNKDEELACIESFSEIITYLKTSRSASGINFAEKDQINCPYGIYVDEKHFKKTGEILGKGITGSVFVVKDNVTEKDHALKTIMISEFRDDELKMWVELNDEDFVPSLLMIKRQENKIHIHMEKLTEAVTLRQVIDELIGNVDADKIKGFSLCILHGLLTAVNKIHDKKWSHNDLHAGNVMLQKKDLTIDLKIIDFGMGRRLEDLRHEGAIRRYETDILSCYRLFTGMYLGQEFDNIFDVKKNGLQKLKEISADFNLPEEDRKEILQLFDVFLEIVDTKSSIFGKTEKAITNVGEVIIKHEINRDEMLEYAALRLFPDKFTPEQDSTDNPKELPSGELVATGPKSDRELHREEAQAISHQTHFPDVACGSDRVSSMGSIGSNCSEVVSDILGEMSIRPRL